MFSPGIERALRASIDAHEGQVRKGREAGPYVVHPIHVAFILARTGAAEDTIQAALLHDVVEDCDDWTLERVDSAFGESVARIVADLTEDKSKSWHERKRAAIEHVPHISAEAAAVKAADKLHNLRSLLDHLQSADDPGEVWAAFRGGRDDTIQMSTELVRALTPRIDPRLATALETALDAVRAHAGDPS